MKVVMWAIVVAALIPRSAQPQDSYELESLLVSSGSDPITSGIAGIARFTNEGGRFAEIAAQSEQAWIAYGQYFDLGNVRLVTAGAIAHVQTAPTLGLRLDANIRLGDWATLDFLYWPGVLLEEPDDWKTENDGIENPESVFHGQFGGVRLGLGPVQLSYYMLNFLDEPWNELPGIAYTRSVREDLAFSLSATWNNNERDWLPWIGMVWSPN